MFDNYRNPSIDALGVECHAEEGMEEKRLHSSEATAGAMASGQRGQQARQGRGTLTVEAAVGEMTLAKPGGWETSSVF